MRLLLCALAAFTFCAAARSQAGQAAKETGSIRVTGWTRTSVEGTPSGGVDHRGTPGTSVRHDDILARELLYLRTRYSRARSFEATLSGIATFGLFKPQAVAQRNDRVRRDASAGLRDAYLGFSAGTFDIRAGVQRVAWGHGDVFSPNDVVNANDIRDPILTETELRRVPTLAIRADVAIAGGSLQLVTEPLFKPDSYDVYGSNWALVQADAPAGYRGFLGYLTTQTHASPAEVKDALLIEAPRPNGLSGAQSGIRYDWRAGPLDVTNYYHYGYHGTPNFSVAPMVAAALAAVDWASPSQSQVDAIAVLLRDTRAVASAWESRHHIGLDLGTTAGPFVLRLDAAYQTSSVFYDRALNGWTSPAIDTALGVEYQTGQLGRTILFEGRYRYIREDLPEGGILYAERHSVDAALLGKWTWGSIDLDTRVVLGVRPRSFLVRPQLGWKKGNGFGVRTGLVMLGGEERSFGDWYRRNRSVYMMVRKDF